MKNLVKSFSSFITEMHHKRSACCGSEVLEDDGSCAECGQQAEMDTLDSTALDDSDLYEDPTFETKKPNRKAVLKAAGEKYPNLKAGSMKKTLSKMSDEDFKGKAEKYFGWADDPEAAAAAFIRKATKKEPRDI